MALRRRRVRALTKGLYYAHMGWLFDVEQTDRSRYAPDLLKDRDIVRVSELFPLWVDGLARCSRRCSAGSSPGRGRAR